LSILFFIVSAAAYPQQPLIEFSYNAFSYPAEKIVSSLQEGHRSEIRFQMRLYREIDGFLRIFGDRLVADHLLIYEARWDSINQHFIVIDNEDREYSPFSSEDEFIRFFLNLDAYRMTIDASDTEQLYLLCRSRIQSIKLVPPLTLMSFLIPRFRETTAWERIPFRIVDP
jgi:hypothetical protein